MSFFVGEDIRTIKTERALFAAMLSVLRRQSFKKTTVKGICEEALISRAAFYAHFGDKYDLVRRWLSELWAQFFGNGCDYDKIEAAINGNLHDVSKVLENLVYDLDDELLGIMVDLIVSTKKPAYACFGEEEYRRNVVDSNFCVGGLFGYITWQIRNKFPAEVPLMNHAVFDIICAFQQN